MASRTRQTTTSGLQHEIHIDGQRAVVCEVGATLRSYTFAGRPVVDGFEADEMCRDGRGQVLAPWPNRLGDGRYQFDGTATEAALNEPSRSNAIHGLVRWLPWHAESKASNAVTMACVLHAQPGYPWQLRLTLEYQLGDSGLSVSATATNESKAVAPFGIGFHPYLTVGTKTVDSVRLRLGAHRELLTDERGLPTGSTLVAGSDHDFSAGPLLGATRLDTCFCQFERDDTGLAWVELEQPGGPRTSVWMDQHFPYAMVYSGDHAGTRPRGSIAIEPMSCPPDAFRSGTDLVRLGAGGSWTGRWGITPT